MEALVSKSTDTIASFSPGVTVIISDFLHRDMVEESTASYEKLLQYLDYCRQRPVVLHTLAREELQVSLEGTLNLIDAEDGSKLRLTVDARSVNRYEKELNRLVERMKKGCVAGKGAYVLCDGGKDRNHPSSPCRQGPPHVLHVIEHQAVRVVQSQKPCHRRQIHRKLRFAGCPVVHGGAGVQKH